MYTHLFWLTYPPVFFCNFLIIWTSKKSWKWGVPKLLSEKEKLLVCTSQMEKRKLEKCVVGVVLKGGDTWTLTYFFINLQFLEKDFLEDYLGQWQMEVERMENMTQTEKNRLLLSKQTIMGWKITSKRILIEIFLLSVYNCEVCYCTCSCSCGMQHFSNFSKMEPSSKCNKKSVYWFLAEEKFKTVMVYVKGLQKLLLSFVNQNISLSL